MNRYMDIYNENLNVLSDPNKIGVGQEIVNTWALEERMLNLNK